MAPSERLRATLCHLATGNESSTSTFSSSISALPMSGAGAAAAAMVDASVGHKLEYTVDGDFLTPEQRQFYEDNGFLVIRGLVPDEDADRYVEQYVRICEGETDPSLGMQLMRDVALAKEKHARGLAKITKIQNFEEDEVLFEYSRHPKIVQYAKAIVGENVKSVHTMLIAKANENGAANTSGRHPLHQDLYYFPFRPTNRICASWTALEKITRANGCLVVLAGSHKGKLLEHEYPEWEGGVNKAYYGAKGLDKADVERRVYLEMDKGDTVFFHPLLIHGSGANRSTGFRKAISTHYASADCFYIDVNGTPQEFAAREIEEIAAKKYGLDLRDFDFTLIWKMKSRLVAGVEGTL